ncbi:hypothetical protein SCUP515_09657 [Seiridium cupressi]
MMLSRSPCLALAVDAPGSFQTGGSVVHSLQFLGRSTNAIYNACRFGMGLASSKSEVLKRVSWFVERLAPSQGIALAAELYALAQFHVMRTCALNKMMMYVGI